MTTSAGIGKSDRDLGVLDTSGCADVLVLQSDSARTFLQVAGLVDHRQPASVAAEMHRDIVTRLVLQRHSVWWSLSTASVVAAAGLVLSVAAPVRPGQDVFEVPDRVEGECGEQAADLVGRQGNQLPEAGSRSPFSAGCWCSVARVAAR